MSAEAIPDRTVSRDFWAGVKLGIPVVVASAPFAVLFGALAVENGFTVAEATLMSATVYGGASQMVGIELFGQKIAPWLVVHVDLRRQLPARALLRFHWPPARALAAGAAGGRLFPADRPAIRRSRA